MVHLAKLFIAFCLFVYGTMIQAQNTIPATGGNAAGTGGNISYTIGQVACMTIPGVTGTVTQGVQQPYEISVVTSLEEAKVIHLICSVYPNPTNNLLTLEVEVYENANFSYWLYGVSGNLIETKKVFSNETQISLGNQVAGSYFLKITSGNKEIKTFKIIKN
jgi:hypothetical protein